MAERKMQCVVCMNKYPWPLDYWPDSTYAVCWPCRFREEQEDHARRLGGAHTLIGIMAFALLLAGAAIYFLVGAPWLTP